MNSIDLFHQNALAHPSKMAIASLEHGELSFRDIQTLSAKTQSLMDRLRIKTGDSVLVALTPSPLLFGVISGLMGLGIRIIFIEPWMGLERIQHVVESEKPKAFLTSTLGKFWGIRSAAIRKISHWVSPAEILNVATPRPFSMEDLPPEHHAFVVFSSGTTGTPKGVVRTHRYMKNIFETFCAVEPETLPNPDLIIFPNVALFHLATGRGSVIVPGKWSRRSLGQTLGLCERYRPQTLSTGPAFIKALLDLGFLGELTSLERIVVGGALTDCWLMEALFEKLPGRKFIHIYGGSEAEPVSVVNAELAVRKSREEGYFQTLCLGKPIPQISYRLRNDILWVSGPNVSGEYVGDPKENAGIKERDQDGRLWHCMGDRVEEKDGFLWMRGRQHQRREDFLLEQTLYRRLQSSKLFLHRTAQDELLLIGEDLKGAALELRKDFPQIKKIIHRKIVRDKRHRSRIDRKQSLPKALRRNA